MFYAAARSARIRAADGIHIGGLKGQNGRGVGAQVFHFGDRRRGDGPGKVELQELAGRLGIGERVHITGIVDRDQMPNFIAALDIAILPNVVRYSSPLKLFEYLAMQCAVIAPDSENIREILVTSETALLFEKDQVQQLSAALADLVRDKMLREKIAMAGQRLIDSAGYTWDENARRIVNHAQLLIAQHVT
jgi:glycosyltransferase involved in cell wall biosynthesis